jgi:fructose-1,6-bisphosphatase I
VIEQAEGKATNGEENILDITPKTVHQRNVIYLGSEKLMEELDSKLIQANELIVRQLEAVL